MPELPELRRNNVNHFFGQYTQSDDQAFANNTGVSVQQVNRIRNFLTPMAERVQEAPLNEEELKKVTERYHNVYIKNLKNKYGFNDEAIGVLREDFKKMAADILKYIERDEPQNTEQYREYLDTYPFLYFNVIPREVIESRIAAKCAEENKLLRSTLADVTKSLSELVLSVSKLQVMTSVPPIARAIFEDLPDPLTANSDTTMFQYYNADIKTYYKVHQEAKKRPDHLNAFLTNPVEFLNRNQIIGGVTQDEIESLKELIVGLSTGKGCFPKGPEQWNHQGPEPPMDANHEDCHHKVRMGNPMHTDEMPSLYKSTVGQRGFNWQKIPRSRF